MGLLPRRSLILLARGTRYAWDPSGGDYLGAMVRSGEGDEAFDDIELAFGEVLNHSGFAVANARKKRLADPLGAGDHADSDAVESRFSGRSLADLRDMELAIAELAPLERRLSADVVGAFGRPAVLGGTDGD
jgi:hypothetical protein